MAKTRNFNIYLLKEGYNHNNTIIQDKIAERNVVQNNISQGYVYVFDNNPYKPWWVDYWGISNNENLLQVSKGAIVFIESEGKNFVLTYGHVGSFLDKKSYEYDFGLKVTLNCIDEKKLKSVDISHLEDSKKQRTQTPTSQSLNFFDFHYNSSILKTLTGLVKDEYKNLFSMATGSSNLKISSKKDAQDVSDLCKELLSLYNKEDYKISFPNINNITPIKDPDVIDKLNAKLLSALSEEGSGDLFLSIPSIVDYNEEQKLYFIGSGRKEEIDDLFIDKYKDFLDAILPPIDLTIDILENHKLLIENCNSQPKETYSISECLLFDTIIEGTNYHLYDGHWYKIEKEFLNQLSKKLDQFFEENLLPDFNHKNEGDYNEYCAKNDQKLILLDKKNISPRGQTQIEPCDLYELRNDVSMFYHIKRSTLSASLSHLFNQGTSSITTIEQDAEAEAKLNNLVGRGNELLEKKKVVYGIITHKDKANKSLNLPLFSRISLDKTIDYLKLIKAEVSFGFIKDCTE